MTSFKDKISLLKHRFNQKFKISNFVYGKTTVSTEGGEGLFNNDNRILETIESGLSDDENKRIQFAGSVSTLTISHRNQGELDEYDVIAAGQFFCNGRVYLISNDLRPLFY